MEREKGKGKKDEVEKDEQQRLFSGYKWIAIDMSAIVDTIGILTN